MSYIITHEKHPNLFELYKASKYANEALKKRDGNYIFSHKALISDFFNEENQQLNIPFPLDALLVDYDYYQGKRTLYILPILVEKQLYQRFQLRMETSEYLEKIKPMFKILISQLREQNALHVLNNVLINQLDQAHFQDIRCFTFLTDLMEFDFNHTFEFNEYFSNSKSGLFGMNALMLAKGKIFVDYLISKGVNFNIKSNPLHYFDDYLAYFENNEFEGHYHYQPLERKYFEKRNDKTALEIAILEKRKYTIDSIKKAILEQQKNGNTENANSLEELEKVAYEKIIHTKKLGTRFNLLVKEFKNNNQYLYHHLDNPLLREVYTYVDGHHKDIVYYAIKHKNVEVLSYLIQQPEILDMAQKNHFKLPGDNKKSYIEEALTIGNRNLVKVLYDAHFHLFNGQALIHFAYRTGVVDIFKDVYQKEKENIDLSYLLIPHYLDELKDYLSHSYYTEEHLKKTLTQMCNVIYVLSAQDKYHPVISSLSYGDKFNQAYFLVAKKLNDEQVLESFKKGSTKLESYYEGYQAKNLPTAKKNLYHFYTKFIKHYPHLEKEAFSIMSTVFSEHNQFISSEKKLLNALLTDKIKNGSERKKNKI